MALKGQIKTHKVCTVCKQDLPREAYSVCQPKRGGSPQISARCKECDYKKHREFSRWRNTGVNAKHYQEMWQAQRGLCAVCNQPSKKQLSADHDHTTMKPRGLLCSRCNTVLGFVKDDVLVLQSAIDYLNRYKQ